LGEESDALSGLAEPYRSSLPNATNTFPARIKRAIVSGTGAASNTAPGGPLSPHLYLRQAPGLAAASQLTEL
jgi:hypothetical protein